MSDKPNDPNDQNDPNDDEKKEDISAGPGPQKMQNEYIPFSKSEKFLDDAEKVFGYVVKIYNKDPDRFCHEKYDIYSEFYRLFQPGKGLSAAIDAVDDIQATIEKALSVYGSSQNEIAVRGDKYKQDVSGLLYVELQSADFSKRITSRKNLHQEIGTEEIASYDFCLSNIIFHLTSRRSYAERRNIHTAGRIILHMSTSPESFWKSGIVLQLIEKLKDFPFILSIKVRDTIDFNRADGILIYTAIAPEEAWQDIKDAVTQIIPENLRSEYHLPFCRPLGLGINANIPIDYIVPGSNSVKTASFTEGIGVLARQALKMLLEYDMTDSDKLPSIFSGALAVVFELNNLKITKDGVLCQPVRLAKE